MKICWYARDGHVDFMPRLANALVENGYDVDSYFVCHTSGEAEILYTQYGITAMILAESLKESNKYSINSCINKIRHYENKYKQKPLRHLLWGEMFEKKYSEETLIRHLVAHFEIWELFIKKNQIDAVVSERPSILSTNTLWLLCQELGIQFIEPVNLGLDERVLFSRSWIGDIDGFDKAYSKITEIANSSYYNHAIEYLKKATTNPAKPKYLTTNLQTGKPTTGDKLYHSLPKIGKIKTVIPRLRMALKRGEYYNNQNIAEQYIDYFIHSGRTTLHRILDIFDKDIDNNGEEYFLFPLHVNNEWVNYQWMGLHYPHIIDLIKKIDACLPLGTKLYVKEHSSGFPDRPLSFYRAIKNLPRVKLINPKMNTFNLLQNTRGLITLGGTMGWECFLIGRPVFTIGKSWYDHLPGIYHIENVKDIMILLQNVDQLALAKNENKLRALVTLFELGFEAVRYPVVDLIKRENILKFINPIAGTLGINKL